jgi:hypothetical protein
MVKVNLLLLVEAFEVAQEAAKLLHGEVVPLVGGRILLEVCGPGTLDGGRLPVGHGGVRGWAARVRGLLLLGLAMNARPVSAAVFPLVRSLFRLPNPSLGLGKPPLVVGPGEGFDTTL